MTSYDDVMRTIVELPDTQLEALGDLCRRDGISRAEAVRRAVAEMLTRERAAAPDRAFGLWRAKPVDAVACQRKLRREWS